MAYGLEKVTSPEAPIYQQLTNYYKFCERKGFSSQTMEHKTRSINYFVAFSGVTQLGLVSNQHIEDWIDHMVDRGNSGRSINNRLSQLKAMLKWERDDCVVMPQLRISRVALVKEAPPRKVFFSRDEINQVLSIADRRDWLTIKLAFDCGLRIGELRKIRLSDIRDRTLRVVGKGQKLRYAIMSAETRTRLDDWIRREKVTDYLWASPRDVHRPICAQSIRRSLETIFEKAGFADFCPHDLRHSYATDLKKLGVPTRKIQVGMGHSSESITERYLSDLDGFDIQELYDVKYSIPEPTLR